MNIVIVWLLTLVVSIFGAFVGQVLCTQPWAIWTVGALTGLVTTSLFLGLKY